MSQIKNFFVNNEFFQNLYMSEYFGVGLIVTITILASLFIIVLIIALRDAKKFQEKDESVKVLESNEVTDNFAFKETEPTVALNVNNEVVNKLENDDEIEIIREDKKEDEFKTADFNFKSLNETIDEDPTVKIDFEALASSLKESFSGDNVGETVSKVVEEKPVFDSSAQSDDLTFTSLLNLANNDSKSEGVESNNSKPLPNIEDSSLKVVDIEMPKLTPSVEDMPQKAKETEEVKFASFKNIENETFRIR